jgi:hypothetical protein
MCRDSGTTVNCAEQSVTANAGFACTVLPTSAAVGALVTIADTNFGSLKGTGGLPRSYGSGNDHQLKQHIDYCSRFDRSDFG